MKVYLDEAFRCHASQNKDGALAQVETDFFDGKCRTYVEGFRYVPDGEVWTREDGTQFAGPMTAPWRDYESLQAVQGAYEDALAAACAQLQPQLDDVLVALVEV